MKVKLYCFLVALFITAVLVASCVPSPVTSEPATTTPASTVTPHLSTPTPIPTPGTPSGVSSLKEGFEAEGWKMKLDDYAIPLIDGVYTLCGHLVWGAGKLQDNKTLTLGGYLLRGNTMVGPVKLWDFQESYTYWDGQQSVGVSNWPEGFWVREIGWPLATTDYRAYWNGPVQKALIREARMPFCKDWPDGW